MGIGFGFVSRGGPWEIREWELGMEIFSEKNYSNNSIQDVSGHESVKLLS